jgi:outer membrane immunogenic protein
MSGLGLHAGIKLPRLASRRATLWLAAGICSLLAVLPEFARAADWPLRGSIEPAGFTRWDGWQFGIQGGYGNMNTDPGNSTSGSLAFILRNTTLENEFAPSEWTTLSPGTTNSALFGAFVGYNMQWDRLVLGFDFAYKRPSNLDAGATDSISRRVVTSDQMQHDVSIDAQTVLKLVDYATLRGRGGYVFGQFLPYAFVGLAVGRFNYTTTVSVSDFLTQLPLTPSPPGGPLGYANLTPSSATTGKDNTFVGGVSAGLGMDWAITPAAFLRAEWEFIAFSSVNGSRSNINTGSLGIGLRF